MNAVNHPLIKFRMDHDLETAEATSGPRATNHMVTWAAEKGAEPPSRRNKKGETVRAELGKLGAFLHELYQAEGWRNPMRRELRNYLREKAKDAMQIAENLAYGDDHLVDEDNAQAETHPAEDESQLQPAGVEEAADWQEGPRMRDARPRGAGRPNRTRSPRQRAGPRKAARPQDGTAPGRA